MGSYQSLTAVFTFMSTKAEEYIKNWAQLWHVNPYIGVTIIDQNTSTDSDALKTET